jgi:hypothetical protein
MTKRTPTPAAGTDTKRCAIYTRKSTSEGLESDFNTLDAQREAAEFYVRAMRHEGWEALPDRYDDGGFTGGNIDRPALQRLLADIEAGKEAGKQLTELQTKAAKQEKELKIREVLVASKLPDKFIDEALKLALDAAPAEPRHAGHAAPRRHRRGLVNRHVRVIG